MKKAVGMVLVSVVAYLAVYNVASQGEAEKEKGKPVKAEVVSKKEETIKGDALKDTKKIENEIKEQQQQVETEKIETAVAPPAQETKKITAIGDSIMVGVTPYLKKAFPDITIDAVIGRQMSQGLGSLEAFKTQGTLGNCILIGLGTNGDFKKEQLVSMIQSLGAEQKVILINTKVPRPWESTVNQKLNEIATTSPNVTLIDWYTASADHKEYFVSDGIHLSKTGMEAYTSLVVNGINGIK
ncbi:hypothetical protein bcgnr5390_61310 [Bacillus luti]|nr:hypothetical protein BC2903_61010 [Bacillus cereus]